MMCAIEIVRGQIDDARAAELLAFWAAHGALDPEEGRRRLPEVVGVVRGADGAIAGVCSVFAAAVPQLGGRTFWVLRSLLPGAAAASFSEVVREAFGALEAEFDGSPGAPIGLCVPVDAAQREGRPEAVWEDPRLYYAGFVGDGRQLRVGYFAGALVQPGEPHGWDGEIPAGHRVAAFAEQDTVRAEDVLALWAREAALDPEEAQRRLGELVLVLTGPGEQLVGVATAYLHTNERLGLPLWYGRVLVSSQARGRALALVLARGLREHFEPRFAAGVETRAAGVAFDVEAQVVNTYYPQAVWPTGYVYMGENAAGNPVRVWYFDGAFAPHRPPQGSA